MRGQYLTDCLIFEIVFSSFLECTRASSRVIIVIVLERVLLMTSNESMD
jgi:hypothetical protein